MGIKNLNQKYNQLLLQAKKCYISNNDDIKIDNFNRRAVLRIHG